NQPARSVDEARLLAALRAFESKLGLVAKSARLLPAVTARNAFEERARLAAQLQSGEMPKPRFVYAPPRPCHANLRWLDHLRAEASQLPAARLYLAKIDELELDVAMLASLGDSRNLRPLAARRFGTGEELIDTVDGPVRLIDYSLRLLTGPSLRRRERPSIPADAAPGELCLRGLVEHVAQAAGLHVSVRVEPNLTAGAATGDRTVFLADRAFTLREAWRLALHEVLGHLTAAENGRQQPLRLLEWGTAFSFADQEGVALCIEQSFGVLDRARLRALAGRVLATRNMHAGASFGETARCLFRDHRFSATDAIAICERAYRGGGVARDVGYLSGYLRVRRALAQGDTTLDELRMGRVGLDALPELRALLAHGLLSPSTHRPNFSRSFLSTRSGTMPWRLPPSFAASLINVELT
ncbi:MAG TPA: tyrosine/phenylalanine carboxypeptidase domain-containing protein, partial [Polyangiales bacterium]|nr:tyrosine/phenylalanine carboxypeptidase domain-containing protein [Polyangiales bacterium]